MADNGTLAFANAVFGTTTGVEEGVLLDAAFRRLGLAITSISSSGQITWAQGNPSPLETGSTGTALRNYGLSTIVCSTSGGAAGYTLTAPAAGIAKEIACIAGSTSSGTATLAAGSGVTFDGTNATVTFTSQGYLGLRGLSATRWAIVGISTGYSAGSVTLSA